MEVFKKIINPGTLDGQNVFCKIELKKNQKDLLCLSITGVIGPKSNGNCAGACGQIDGELKSGLELYAIGWDADLLARFLHVWEIYHLNDMKVGCEHQRAERWGTEKITVIKYSYTTDTFLARERLEKSILKAAAEGKPLSLSDDERYLLNLPRGRKWDCNPLSAHYKEMSRETKYSGHVKPEEHPKGVLCKPCPICGYKYGTSWLYLEIPEKIIEFLKALPDSIKIPAWV